jgi:hypothetical protein
MRNFLILLAALLAFTVPAFAGANDGCPGTSQMVCEQTGTVTSCHCR